MKLTLNQIEVINSLGPFNHSAWRKGSLCITQEEVLEGRADFIVTKIRDTITKNFTLSQIRQMSIVDIGCYDGYILHQLTDLPFKKMIGIEPRQKNIDKGVGIRKILGIDEKIKFKRTTLEKLGKNEKFDIVLCIGVLHHVESISVAIKKLDKICSQMLILENLCIPSIHITDDFKIDIEMKDLIYKKENLCGITGQKFESSYYDGSAESTSVISIPSIETMMMLLTSLGHTNFTVAATPEDFSIAMKKNTRPSKEVLIYSIKSSENVSVSIDETINTYESGIINTCLNEELVQVLYDKYVNNFNDIVGIKKYTDIINYVEGSSNDLPSIFYNDKDSNEDILKSLRFNKIDKITFEYAKIQYRNNNLEASIKSLEAIIYKINSDWRTCYRSFYLLSEINKKLNRKTLVKKYLRLCKSCNPDFPLI